MEKNRSTFILAAHGLGLLTIAMSCFVGSLYIFNDNFAWSVIVTLLTLAILLSLVYLMSGAKERKENKGFTVMEGVGLFIYAIMAVATFVFMAHFINVNLILKDDIVKTGLSKLDELKVMVDTYEKKVETVANEMRAGTENLIIDYKTSNRYPLLKDSLLPYGIQINEPQLIESEVEAALITTVDAAMLGIPDLRNENNDFSTRNEPVFSDWTASEVQSALEATDERLNANYSRLRKQFVSQSTPPNYKWNTHTFDFQVSAPSDLTLDAPFALMKNPKYNLVLPLLAALVVHLFILCPYLLMGRYGIRRIYPSAKKAVDIKGSINIS